MTAGDTIALGLLVEALAAYLAIKKSTKPAMAALRGRAWDRLLKALREFGLTPSSRTGVQVLGDSQSKDPKARFFKPRAPSKKATPAKKKRKKRKKAVAKKKVEKARKPAKPTKRKVKAKPKKPAKKKRKKRKKARKPAKKADSKDRFFKRGTG